MPSEESKNLVGASQEFDRATKRVEEAQIAVESATRQLEQKQHTLSECLRVQEGAEKKMWAVASRQLLPSK